MLAEMVQVPALTNVTNPVEELMVQTLVVELLKLFVPPPIDAVEVMVGAVAVIR